MKKYNTSILRYNKKDFNLNIEVRNEGSKFDKLLKEKWKKIEQENILRYDVKSQVYKILEGKYGFYLQLNVERGNMRRKPEEITSMLQPFNSNRFNFNKISDKEILFDIGNGDGNDIIVVNVSPILWSHCLLLTQRFSNLPQQVTLYSFQKAIEILLLSNSENMRVIFNSLCANASVNHLHWHFYYLNHRMVLEWIPLQSFIDLIYTLEDFPAKGFCIKLSSFGIQNFNKYVSYTYKIVAYLQECQMAHNIYITRSKTSIHKEEFDDIRIYIWVRTPAYGIKNIEEFVIAACELFGHVPIKTKEAYTNMTEDYTYKSTNQLKLVLFIVNKINLLNNNINYFLFKQFQFIPCFKKSLDLSLDKSLDNFAKFFKRFTM